MSNPRSTATAEIWSPPAVHGRRVGSRGEQANSRDRKQRAELEAIYAKAQTDGFAFGQTQFDARNAQLQERIDRLDAMLQSIARPFAEMEAQAENQLVTMALTVARHLVRRELRIDPTQVIAIIRSTVALLPTAAREVRVHLHPEDAAVVRERLSEPRSERAWTIVEDPITTRGGCRVTTDTAHIDARLETRIGAAITAVLGSERLEQRDPPTTESDT
jgi:flagellar assembly protein FliH